MSAFVVSKSHIDAIVTTANNHQHRYSQPRGMTADELGRMLWAENVKSVQYRYPGFEDLPGPADFTSDDVAEYRCSLYAVRVLTPVQALKAIRCLEYQSCEHPEWEASDAFKFCETFRAEAISLLPGYEDADWEIE